jgi:hypothetical protein
MGVATLPVGTAVVKKIRSPQITGVENPLPGIAIFHFTFFASPNSVGATVRAIPLRNGPRHCGQCAGSFSEKLTLLVTANRKNKSIPTNMIHLFIVIDLLAKNVFRKGLEP